MFNFKQIFILIDYSIACFLVNAINPKKIIKVLKILKTPKIIKSQIQFVL